MAKVLYLPLNGSIIQTGMYDAFRDCGVDLTIFDFYQKKQNNNVIRKEFLDTVNKVQPDLIHMQLQFTSTIDGNTLVEAKKLCPKAVITNWTGDIRKDVPGEFVNASIGVDISLISSVGQIDLYKSKLYNKDVRYWQIGYNPKLYYPINNKNFKYDLAFIASKYSDNLFPDAKLRTDTAQHLLKKHGDRFALFGGGWTGKKHRPIDQSLVNSVYAESFAVLSISNFNSEYLYFSDRLLMCLASGRPTICWTFPGWEAYFSDMKNIIMVSSIDQIDQKLEWLKNNEAKADEIGKAGADLVLREHSYFNRAAELLRMVGLQ